MSGATMVEAKEVSILINLKFSRVMTLQSCMLGDLSKECLLTITKLLLFTFLGNKKETHMHTLCVPSSPSKKLLCVYVLMCFPHTLVHICSFSKK
jgi:hypothetical protein